MCDLFIWDKDMGWNMLLMLEIRWEQDKWVGSCGCFERVVWNFKEEEQEITEETKFRDICWEIKNVIFCNLVYV